jgi:hypothetical protein
LHEHGGAVPGFRAHIFVLPQDNLGVVVLANVDDSSVVLSAGYSLLDHLLGLKKKDWVAFYREQTDKQVEKTRGRHRKLLASRRTGSHPARELDAYAGTYFEPAYGTARVRVEGEQLALSWSSFRVALEHFHFDTFLPQVKEDHPLRDERVRFELDDEGNVAVLHFLGRNMKRRSARE